ncbi:MAG: PepSY-associated TM helix domain-containing protein [Woeseiaceae bacterium]
MANNNKAKLKIKRSVFHWHRQIGLVVALLAILLSITGILLNHTEEFELDSQHIKSEFLLNWYGIKKPSITSYAVGKDWISHAGHNIYLNDASVDKEIINISGAVALENFIAVATENEIILLTPDGEKIERLDATTGVPNHIAHLGVTTKQQLALQTKSQILIANNDVTEWKESENKNILWAKKSALPKNHVEALNKLFRGEGLSKERVMLDLHSGRILGKAGPLLMDLSAILLIVLSFTGVWMYAKRSWVMRKRNLLLEAAQVGDAYSAADLKRGEEGIVLTVIGDEKLRQRLASMGIMAGTVIGTPSTSVFSDPRTYKVRGYQLCMRITEASMILLQTEEQAINNLEQSSEECPIPEKKIISENN